MAIKTVTFSATPDGVTPAIPQDAGVQGDHQATAVIFRLDPALISVRYQYRWEFVDGNGRFDTTEAFSITAEQTEVSAPLLSAWTRAGGTAEIRLVITDPGQDGTEEPVTLYTLAGRLRFQGRDCAALQEQELKKGLTRLIEETKSAAKEAKTQAAAAGAAATNADSMARFADSAGQQAHTAKDAANRAASAAAQKAADAQTAARLAETAAQNANDATTSANTATSNAQNAADYAAGKGNYADTAAAQAITATNTANAAANAANAAAERADGMVDRYDRVIPYVEATTINSSGVIVALLEPTPEKTAGLCVRVKVPSAFDMSNSLTVAGGDNPWAASIAADESVTGYTPSWPAGIYTFTYDGTVWRLPLPLAAGTAYTDNRADQAITSSAQYTDNTVGAETARARQAETALAHEQRRSYSPALHGTASGEAARLTDSAVESDFSRLAVAGRTTQDGTPSPDAPVDVAGVQPSAVRVCGRNLADESNAKWAVISGNPPYLLKAAAAAGTDNAIPSAGYRGLGVWAAVRPGTKYTARIDGIAYSGAGAASFQIGYYRSAKDVYTSGAGLSKYSRNVTAEETAVSVSFAAPEDCHAVVVIYGAYPVAAGETIRADHITVMEGTEAAYEPYTGTDYPLELDSPLYSTPDGARDEVDLVSGMETRRCGSRAFTGTETWTTSTSGETTQCFTIDLADGAVPAGGTHADTALCSHFPYRGTTSASGQERYCTYKVTATGKLRLMVEIGKTRLTGWSDDQTAGEKAALFQAWLAAQAEAGTPVTVAYGLAEPSITEHGRTDIAQPAPEANVSADGAPVELTYSRDLQTVIDALQAAVSAANVGPSSAESTVESKEDNVS